jgi:cell wall assembly regulator SMI1
MKAIWDRIHRWLKVHAPDVLASLRPGATQARLREVEDTIGAALPEEVRRAYGFHDGQATSRRYGCAPGFLYGWEWLSLNRMLSDWKCSKGLLDDGHFEGVNSEPKGPIRADWWHPRWITVTVDGGGGQRCIDLAPRRGGRVGQVISWWHDSGAGVVLAPNFRVWLARFADELERGDWATSPEYDGMVLADELEDDPP